MASSVEYRIPIRQSTILSTMVVMDRRRHTKARGRRFCKLTAICCSTKISDTTVASCRLGSPKNDRDSPRLIGSTSKAYLKLSPTFTRFTSIAVANSDIFRQISGVVVFSGISCTFTVQLSSRSSHSASQYAPTSSPGDLF